MKLPEQSAKNILSTLTSKSLLSETAAADVVDCIEKEKDVNWNLVLTKQLQSEQGGLDEADS